MMRHLFSGLVITCLFFSGHWILGFIAAFLWFADALVEEQYK